MITFELPFSVSQIWEIFQSFLEWGPKLESYVSHEVINDQETIWTFKSNIGLVKKKISAKVEILQWNCQECLSVHVTGVNENFNGTVTVETKETGTENSLVTISQNMTVKGTLKKVVANRLSKSPSEKKQKKVAADITEKLKKIDKLIKNH